MGTTSTYLSVCECICLSVLFEFYLTTQKYISNDFPQPQPSPKQKIWQYTENISNLKNENKVQTHYRQLQNYVQHFSNHCQFLCHVLLR